MRKAKLNYQLGLVVGLVFFGFLNPIFGQTVDVTNTDYTISDFVVNDSQIFGLQIIANDADYNNEGLLIINGNTNNAIQLFPGASTATDGQDSSFGINLSDAQQALFNLNGAPNTLLFQYTDPMNGDVNYTIISVTPVTQKPERLFDVVEAEIDTEISNFRLQALELYKRLVGVRVPIDHPKLKEMEAQLASGNRKAAAQIATGEDGFFNMVVRDFAAQMSTREQDINTTFNDFIATFIGVVRDGIDARELLSGSFIYVGGPAVTTNRDPLQNFVRSNSHYETMQNQNYNYVEALTKQDFQYVRPDRQDRVEENDDAAGVLTSRAFMGAHAIDGTNRRIVEFTMKQFACLNIEEWADANAPDTRVGMDIDRFPGGEGNKYQTTCKACHSVMDGFRGAFAKYDFDDNSLVYRTGNFSGDVSRINRNGNNIRIDGVDNKYNQNHYTFRAGHITTNNSWVNNARSPANVQLFGWRGVFNEGSGAKQFGRTVANSRIFSKCMTKRVYREICRRPVSDFEDGLVEGLSQRFESSGYNLRSLFEDVAIRSECLGAR